MQRQKLDHKVAHKKRRDEDNDVQEIFFWESSTVG